jgi:hypothetical protein
MTDFASYIQKLQRIAGEMQGSGRFVVQFTLHAPAHPDDLDEMVAELAEEPGMTGLSIPAEMKAFYTAANGFHLAWQELRPGGDRVVAGLARLPIINEIYEPDDGQPRSRMDEDYRLFDWVGEEDQVYMKLTQGVAEPRLFYYAQDTGRYHELPLGFSEYLELLLEARAMYPWQRLFVTDPELRLDAAARDAFVQTLERLFPGADTSRFMPRLLR